MTKRYNNPFLDKIELSKRGVSYNLMNTPYFKTIHYENGKTCVFKFSSKLYREKFEKSYEKNRDILNKSLSERFKMNFNLDMINDIILYGKVEKRGFLIDLEGELITWKNNIICVGGVTTLQN